MRVAKKRKYKWRNKNMKRSKGMQLGVLLAAMLLLSMVFVPVVSAWAANPTSWGRIGIWTPMDLSAASPILLIRLRYSLKPMEITTTGTLTILIRQPTQTIGVKSKGKMMVILTTGGVLPIRENGGGYLMAMFMPTEHFIKF
jgi:hypothetical protein